MFLTLVKLRWKAIWSSSMNGTKKKTSGGKKLLYLLLGIYIVVVFGGLFSAMFFPMVEPFQKGNMLWLYFSYAAIMAFLFCFIGSVFMTQNQLYNAKDNDLMLSMPIPTKYILASRTVAILGLNYAYEALIVVPAIVVLAMQVQLPVMNWIFLIVGFLLLPVFTMVFSAIFGYIMAYINSKTGNKNYISLFLTIALFMAYMFFCFRIQHYIGMLINKGEAIADVIKSTLPPFYHLGVSISDGNILSFIIYIAFVIVPFIAVYYVLDKSFIKIATSSKSGSKKVYRAKEIKTTSMEMSLIKKEISRFTGNTMYMFNAGIGLFFLVIAGIAVIIKRDDINQFIGDFGGMVNLDGNIAASCLAIGALLICSLVTISAPSISLESKTLWILKSLPVSTKTILMSKVYAHILICVPFIVFFGIVSLLTVKFTIIGAIGIFALPLVHVIYNALFGVLINLKFPKFDWVNETAAVKQGMAPFIATIVSMGTSLVIGLISIAIISFGGMALDILIIVLIGLHELGAYILYRILIRKGVRLFDNLIS